MSVLRFHILHNSGWIGNSDQRPVNMKRQPMQPLLPGDSDINKQTITNNEAAWDRAGLLMPSDVRQMLRNEQEKTTDQELLRREYALDAAPEADENILLPIGVRG